MNRPGYVLLMTLLLLAVATTTLAAVAAQNRQRAMAAQDAQAQMQRRWGSLSCQWVLLPHAGDILRPKSPQDRHRTGSIKTEVELGGQLFALHFGDEQAKLNLNMLANQLHNLGLAGVVDRFASRVRAAHLSPANGRFDSYGQIFGNASPAALLGDKKHPGLAAQLTCWGDGRLNTDNASMEAVEEVASIFLQPAEFKQLTAAWERSPKKPWQEMFEQLHFPPDRTKVMQQFTTTSSQCFSLWIVAGSDQRPAYRFAVLDAAGGNMAFEW